jgi:drug/metabolite transporter (DMT)-like permease
MWMLVALIAAHTLTTLGYHLMAKYLGVSLDGGDGRNLLMILFDPRFWGLVVIELGSFGLWLLILARIELGKAILLSAVSYCVIMVVGALVFHERVGWTGYAGSAMILGGIALLAGAGEGNHDR